MKQSIHTHKYNSISRCRNECPYKETRPIENIDQCCWNKNDNQIDRNLPLDDISHHCCCVLRTTCAMYYMYWRNVQLRCPLVTCVWMVVAYGYDCPVAQVCSIMFCTKFRLIWVRESNVSIICCWRRCAVSGSCVCLYFEFNIIMERHVIAIVRLSLSCISYIILLTQFSRIYYVCAPHNCWTENIALFI